MMISAVVRAMPVRAMATKTVKKGKQAPSSNNGRTLWLPNVESPPWLDGSLPGDAGEFPLSTISSQLLQPPCFMPGYRRQTPGSDDPSVTAMRRLRPDWPGEARGVPPVRP